MIQSSIAFTPEMHRRLALAALEERVTIMQIIREAVAVYLDRRDAKRKGRGRA
jgi:hypothetical protein